MLGKIGIITHYYNSTNYGGILQSYALCKYLNQNGCEAKQIRYNTVKYPIQLRVKHFLAYHCMQLKSIIHPVSQKKINKRKKAITAFRNSIPHTEKVYSDKNLFETNEFFDGFITGSDQVWHPSVINKGYSLLFSDKPRFSYAASIASDGIPDIKRPYYDEIIKSFDSISVRERKAQELLSVDTKLVLDPVFLLPFEDWDALSSERIIGDEYVFCYFLGYSKEAREAAIGFAKKNSLKVVNIPYLNNNYKINDEYGDYSLSDISPCDFLSLIKNAKYVLTDSFHAICFSFIFKKQFFVFGRESKSVMGARITDILNTLDLQSRYLDDPGKIVTNKNDDVDYRKKRSVFEVLQHESFSFIDSIIRYCRYE